ncbi:hypothetical protein GCM10009113_06590 [Marinobacter szutsaonensis]
MNDLQQLLQEITGEWSAAKAEAFTNHPLANKFRNEFVNSVKEVVADINPKFIVKGSVGAGNWANVPWLSILDPEITTTTQDGVYPVYLFKADGSGVYLSLNQGTTNPAKQFGKRRATQRATEFAENARSQISGLVQWGQTSIDLLASTSLGKSYEVPNIIAKYYPASAVPDSARLEQDLNEMLRFYEKAKPLWISFQEKISTGGSSVKRGEETQRLPKPFILMAGISGTGKTRFVRQQAKLTGSLDETYCLVPVRPDWHEPSDLLGYISRLGADGPRYVVSDVLRFMVSAWKEIITNVEISNGRPEWVGRDLAEIRPFWLCLDEMNLAPVEQYFADFLSILETRHFLNEEELQQFNADNAVERSYVYSSDPVLKPEVFAQLDSAGKLALRSDLGLADDQFDGLWDYFSTSGIPLPFNLIVAGTVNMDETTHGFSRKVIDRALSIDFGGFFPNEFDQFFDQQTEPVALSYPLVSSVTSEDLKVVGADPDGTKTVGFLSGINSILKGSPYELAYRALNELLLSVVSQNPQDQRTLQAVWDDFLMMKVLPRIEGDQEKLAVFDGTGVDTIEPRDVLGELFEHLKASMAEIWESDRPDLLRSSVNEREKLSVECRSKAKLKWMRHRLQTNGFTSFWP